MKRRITALVLTFNFLFLFLCGRLFRICSTPQTVSTNPSLRVREIDKSRGFIYDCNLKPLVNTDYSYTFIIKPGNKTVNMLSEKGFSNESNGLKKGKITFVQSDNKNELYESDAVKRLSIFKRYSESTALHIVGYTDYTENGVCGIEKYYNKYLNECGAPLSVAYTADANGRLLTAEKIEIRNSDYYTDEGIVLTIDKDIQLIAENALKNNNIAKGAVIVLDSESSAILACASTPTYDRSNLDEYLNNDDAPFLNRGFSAYPVGSVFKLVTAVSALENNITLPSYNCTGKTEKSGTVFNCNKTEGHGTIALPKAVSHSCNTYFIELGTITGAKKLLHTAEAAGFGKSTDLGNGYFTDAGVLPQTTDLNSDAAVGNFAFGQGKLTATPLQIAGFLNVLANGGIYKEPYLIKGYVNEEGAYYPEAYEKSYRIFKESSCKEVKNAMLNTVKDGTGALAFSSLFDSCSKTATAQSGQYDEDGHEIKICWFTGFFPVENPKYTICVIKENGVSGGVDCAPVFKEISENIHIKSKTLP